MLTRPGSDPGCAWMQRLDERFRGADPQHPGKPNRFFWIWFVVVMVMMAGLNLSRRWTTDAAGNPKEYVSEASVTGLPLLASGQHPRGIIALGSFPVGVIAIGGVPIGVVAIGGVALGAIAIGGLSAGILALAGLAAGWWALGGGAVGYHAFGGLAVGGYAYSGGGVAFGYHEASGGQKEKLLG